MKPLHKMISFLTLMPIFFKWILEDILDEICNETHPNTGFIKINAVISIVLFCIITVLGGIIANDGFLKVLGIMKNE